MAVPTWSVYRADCIPHKTGCRQCGCLLKSASRAYCSAACRIVFEINHFWHSARLHCILRANPDYDAAKLQARQYPRDWFYRPKPCAKCKQMTAGGALEVNHIVPLNGNRPHFGCCHHQSNLEPLCHDCHVEETNRQRRAGEIGPPRVPYATPLIDVAEAAS